MKAILNDQIFDLEELKLKSGNRGFKYGDGLFETIAVRGGEPRLLEYHLMRMLEGAEYLNLETNVKLNSANIALQISKLRELNDIKNDAIAKLYLWRNSPGKYEAVERSAETLLTLENTTFQNLYSVENAGFSLRTVNYPTEYSHFKTINALKYVVAGNEKLKRGLDEIIILDHHGNVSEALSSNIFWKKGNNYFTSPLSTGCISGVMRKWIMEKLHEKGIPVEEKLIGTDEFVVSDSVFTSNAAGIVHIKSIENHQFGIDSVVQGIIESGF